MGESDGRKRWVARFAREDITVTSPAPRDVWESVLARDPTALPSQTPEWLDCVCASGTWTDGSRLYERGGERPLILPLAIRSWAGETLSIAASLPPGWGPGGIVAPGGPNEHDVRAVVADVGQSRALRVTLRPGFRADAYRRAATGSGVVVVPRLVHVLDLDGGFSKVWSQRFTAETRKGMRRAEARADKAGVTIERGNSPSLVADFYDVYMRWLDGRAQQRPLPAWVVRWGGRRADPRHKFERVARALGDACIIYVARLGGRPVAADFSVWRDDTMVTWRGMSDGDAGARLRLNELVLQQSIRDACELGCRHYEMGESGGVASLERFKLRFGAQPVHLAEYRLERMPLTPLGRAMSSARDTVESTASRARDAASRARPSPPPRVVPERG